MPQATILVVEDESIIRLLLGNVLIGAGIGFSKRLTGEPQSRPIEPERIRLIW